MLGEPIDYNYKTLVMNLALCNAQLTAATTRILTLEDAARLTVERYDEWLLNPSVDEQEGIELLRSLVFLKTEASND